jgi:hypothetical protein
MSIDAIFSGTPSTFPAGGSTRTLGLETGAGALWVNPGTGWQPVSNADWKSFVLATTAAQPSLLVVTVPVTGLYTVTVYASQNTATNGTPPQFQIAYTEGDTGTVFTTASFGTPVATTGVGQSNTATVTINAKAGTVVTVSSLAPTTLTANIKARLSYFG